MGHVATFALALFAIASAPSAACASPISSVTHPHSAFLDSLPTYLARWEKSWPRIREMDPFYGKALSTRRFESVRLDHRVGSPVARGDSAFAHTSDWTSCTEQVYRHFLVGQDTISFTYGRVPEGCNESPRMIWHAGPRVHRAVMRPLYDWNVHALWITPHWALFGLAATYEGSSLLYVRIACWQLSTGRWFTTLSRDELIHRPGFDLTALLPDWASARAYEVGESIVLRGKENALALSPGDGSWALLRSADGTAIPPKHRRLPRQLLTPAEKWVQPKLKARIRASLAQVHDKAHRDIADFNLLEVMKAPCSAYPRGYAVLARAVGQDRQPGGPQFDLNRELFGVFVADSSGNLVKAFTPFPSRRWDDYAAYFDLDASDDSIGVWAQGATYGDEEAHFVYPCRRRRE